MLAKGAKCAAHPAVAAVDLCSRCGSYVCLDCTEPESFETYCPDCYRRSSPRAPASTRATGALVMALLAFSGCVPLAFPAVILAHMELGAIERGESSGGVGTWRGGRCGWDTSCWG
ncbi:MAG: hypothetical protein RLO52_07635 [Sandaracinaceae bacterium]